MYNSKQPTIKLNYINNLTIIIYNNNNNNNKLFVNYFFIYLKI